MDLCGTNLAADDDNLLASWQEYGGCGGSVSRRGYWILAIDLEGTEVCDWLTAKGITCVLLKYRVPGNGLEPRSGPYPKSPLALEDAQRTVGLVRFHAAEWHINPHKIGVLGFSAGGHLAAAISTHFEQRVYEAVDAT